MKPTVKIASTQTPDKGKMELYQHGRDFSIKINGCDLMLSRQHESELELSRLGCAHLTGRPKARILIGGMGMGHTLRQALDMVGPDAQVTVVELVDAVVEWNREFLGELNGHPLKDRRTVVEKGDVMDIILRSKNRFDAILLDVDNGPEAMTDSGNQRLYERQGIYACGQALRDPGCLGIWSAEPSKKFERVLMSAGFHARRFRARAYKGAKSRSRVIWVASKDRSILPSGGGEPDIPGKTKHRPAKNHSTKNH